MSEPKTAWRNRIVDFGTKRADQFQAHPQECWRDIPGYDGIYSVSNRGRVRLNVTRNRYRAGSIRTGQPNADGYLRLSMTHNGQRKKCFVHRLVALAFLGPRDANIELNHKNGVKTDNRVENLEYVTHRENMCHAVDMGLWNPARGVGEEIENSKLTVADIRAIREEYSCGDITYAQLGKHYGVVHQNISSIVNRKTWKHVE